MNKKHIASTLALSLILPFLLTIPTSSLSTPPVKAAGINKISPALAASLQPQTSNTLVSVIILTNGVPSLALKTLIIMLGGVVKLEFAYLNGLAASLPLSGLGTLALLSEVHSITPDRPISPLLDVTLPTVGADVAQQSYGLDGNGVGIAVIDSGINDDHEDLTNQLLGLATIQKRVVYSYNFVRNESTTQDLYGHGTHVAGIIAGDGSASSGPSSYRTIKGIAPRAKLINLRVLDSQGSGAESDVIAAVEKAVSLKSAYNIKILNLSLGAGVFDSYANDPLCKAVDLAWSKGLVVVVSAGNYGNTPYGPYGFITSPGNSPSSITVGATNSQGTVDSSDDTITTYSSRGPTLFDHVVKPDLVAPGNRVKSLLAENSTLARDPRFASNKVDPSYCYTFTVGKTAKYFTLSGTSMAAPVVAGAAALILQKDPSLNNHTVKLRLMASSKKIFSQRYDLLTVGAGLLDIPSALRQTATATSSRSPYLKRDPNNTNIYLVIDDQWGSQSSWGSSVVWGGNIDAGSTVWGGSVVWGGSIIWGNSVVWGGASPFSDPNSNLYDAAAASETAASGDQ